MFGFRKRKNKDIRQDIRRENGGVPAAVTELLGGGYNSNLQIVTVYACVRVIAETLGMLPINLYDTSDKNKVKLADHPLTRCLAISPNSYQTSAEFMEYLATSVCLEGNFYAQIIRNSDGQVCELWPLDPYSVGVYQDSQNSKVYYSFKTKNGKVIKTTERDIFHVKIFSLDGYKGVSALTYARSILDLENKMTEYANNVFTNGSICNGAICVPTKLNQDAYADTQDVIEEQFAGSGMRPMLLEGGATWQSIQISAQDSQVLETRRFNREEIAKIFRVPAHMVGDMEHSTFSNIEHQSLEFMTNTMSPYLRKIEQRIVKQLLSEDEQKIYKPRFNLASALKGDLNSRYSAYNTAINCGILCPDEIREVEDLPPRPDGLGGRYLQPLNMTVAGQEQSNDGENDERK
jgi:HK97 family phage portal protein